MAGKKKAVDTEKLRADLLGLLNCDDLWPAGGDFAQIPGQPYRLACCHRSADHLDCRVYPAEGRWECCGCGRGGGPWEWLTDQLGLEEEEALAELRRVALNRPPSTNTVAWLRFALRPDRSGNGYATGIENAVLLLEHDPLVPRVWLNTFDLIVYLEPLDGGPTRPLRDEDYAEIVLHMASAWGVEPGLERLAGWVGMVARRRSRNPLQEWLRSLRWDGEGRLDGWLRAAYGVGALEEDEALVPSSRRDEMAAIAALYRAYARKWMIQAVARALEPGCKADSALVFVGPQGQGKSTSVEILAGESYYAPGHMGLDDKDNLMCLYKVWLCEWAELSQFKKAESETVKEFLSRKTDTFRPPYGRVTVDHLRHTVFFGTSNEPRFLKDPTGSRRFWPIFSPAIVNRAWLRENREQLWGEAVALFDAWVARGRDEAECLWWLTREEEAVREDQSRTFEVDDVLEAEVAETLRGGHTEVTVQEVLRNLCDRKIPGVNMDRLGSERVGKCLRHLGCKEAKELRRYVQGANGGQRVYRVPAGILGPVRPEPFSSAERVAMGVGGGGREPEEEDRWGSWPAPPQLC